jgi:hypothetical protein
MTRGEVVQEELKSYIDRAQRARIKDPENCKRSSENVWGDDDSNETKIWSKTSNDQSGFNPNN